MFERWLIKVIKYLTLMAVIVVPISIAILMIHLNQAGFLPAGWLPGA